MFIKNGIVITVETGDDENGARYLWQRDDDTDDDRESLSRLADVLRAIVDDWGPSTSRYSEARIYIEVRPGDKHGDVE